MKHDNGLWLCQHNSLFPHLMQALDCLLWVNNKGLFVDALSRHDKNNKIVLCPSQQRMELTDYMLHFLDFLCERWELRTCSNLRAPAFSSCQCRQEHNHAPNHARKRLWQLFKGSVGTWEAWNHPQVYMQATTKHQTCYARTMRCSCE